MRDDVPSTPVSARLCERGFGKKFGLVLPGQHLLPIWIEQVVQSPKHGIQLVHVSCNRIGARRLQHLRRFLH
jgi:hypothetical protein